VRVGTIKEQITGMTPNPRSSGKTDI